MKKSAFPLLVILILAALFATTPISAAIVPEHGPSAFGSGLFSSGIRRVSELNSGVFLLKLQPTKTLRRYERQGLTQ